jgi:hypothetical protein
MTASYNPSIFKAACVPSGRVKTCTFSTARRTDEISLEMSGKQKQCSTVHASLEHSKEVSR